MPMNSATVTLPCCGLKARTLTEIVCGSEYGFPKQGSALRLSQKISSISSSGPLSSAPSWLCEMCGSPRLVTLGSSRNSSPQWVGFSPGFSPFTRFCGCPLHSKATGPLTIFPQNRCAGGGLSKQPITVLWQYSVVQVKGQSCCVPTFA